MVMEMHGAQWKDSHISPDYEPSSLITHTTHHPIYPRSPQQPQQPQQQPDYPRPSTPIAASRVASPSIAIPVPQASSHTLGVATLTAPAVDRRHTRHASLDLFEYIENNPFFAERKVKHIFHQVALAVQYLHQNNIVHNDIKDENVVIDAELHAKLIDFGAAQFVPNHPSDYFEDFRGTNHYMPPEAVRGERYRGPEVDVWCMGVLLYTMAFSCPPFRTRDDIATASYRHPRFKRSAALMDLINAMLKVDPAQRLTMDQVVAHPWLANNASNMPLSPMPVSPLPHD
ncbi:hypothetical protein HK105_205558 [Polyrhizophydium stewartii]|uniref:Protein kinase domain-containing protein n=1 Tax=Polyrhizophydium stewartii TaxID=2732419 RepID=A0ABR4N5S4_9FUNG|nr:hypothetical protein HK105_008234 [Polyrhizophydium stewartii]